MAAPLSQNALTPWDGYTFGRLRELALRQTGVSDPAHASPDSSLPEATAQEVAVMSGFVHEGLCELQERRERYWPISEASVTAESDGAGSYPSVLLPSDFGTAFASGFYIDGEPIKVITTEEWLRTRRSAADGGGTTLTEKTGTPSQTRCVLRILPARQDQDTDPWRLAAWLYPVQTAAWTLDVAYRATAKNHTDDDWTVRLPRRLYRPLMLYCAMRSAEFRGDAKAALEASTIYNRVLSEVEDIAPSEEQQSSMILSPPAEGGNW